MRTKKTKPTNLFADLPGDLQRAVAANPLPRKPTGTAIRLLLEDIATICEAPRDRFGRLDICHGTPEGDAREAIRVLAVSLGIGGCRDTLEQFAQVARALLAGGSRNA